MSTSASKLHGSLALPEDNSKQSDIIYDNIKQTLIDQGVVFFGGYALSKYSFYMPEKLKHKLDKIPDFDVVCKSIFNFLIVFKYSKYLTK